MVEPFVIPIVLDLLATFALAVTGATAARQRGYDYIGVIMTGLVSAIGGSLVRDGIFLQRGAPVAVSDSRYILVILLGCASGALVSRLRRGIQTTLVIIDAFGLGAYAMIGTHASLQAGIPPAGAALVGLLNAVGGGMLRDIALREEPMVFKPSEHYAGAALAGILLFLALTGLQVPRFWAASAGLATTFAVRMLSAWFGWKTKPLYALGWMERPAPTPVSASTSAR